MTYNDDDGDKKINKNYVCQEGEKKNVTVLLMSEKIHERDTTNFQLL